MLFEKIYNSFQGKWVKFEARYSTCCIFRIVFTFRTMHKWSVSRSVTDWLDFPPVEETFWSFFLSSASLKTFVANLLILSSCNRAVLLWGSYFILQNCKFKKSQKFIPLFVQNFYIWHISKAVYKNEIS